MDKQNRINRTIVTVLLTAIIGLFAMNASVASEPEFLPAEKAFLLNANRIDNNKIKLHFSIAPGFVLYQQQFQFQTLDGKSIAVPLATFPTALIKKDEGLGEYPIYKKSLDLILPLAALDAATKKGIRVLFQGCSEEGFCYNPLAKEVVVLANNEIAITDISPELFGDSINNAAAGTTTDPTSSAPAHDRQDRHDKQDKELSQSDYLTNQIKTGNYPLTLAIFLGLGLLLAFTPCVLPMIPILANIVVGKDQSPSSRRSIFLATLFVLSVSVCYAAAGVAAGFAGNHLQMALQQPVFLVTFSILISIFALSQFNLIHIPVPQFFEKTWQGLQDKQKQGSAFGAIAMGALSAVMVSPCVTPALVGALVYIGDTGNAILGGLALFALALGMGLPLLVFACIGSHFLPKAGNWMVYIRGFTGVLLLVLAGSIMLRAFPISTLLAKETTTIQTPFKTVQNEQEFTTALNTARALGKPVILDVYADWCVTCKQLDREVFANQKILAILEGAELLRLDVTRQTEGVSQLQKNLGIVGPPTLIFFSPDGEEAKHYRVVGKIESEKFLELVNRFLKNQ